jgi:CheY-like chemotaxis protein
MKKILVVDDDDFIRLVMAKILRTAGYEIGESADGTGAVEKLEAQSYDLVVTDAVLISQNGLYVAEYVRKKIPHMPILVVSSHAQGTDSTSARNNSKKCGNEQLQKPFGRTEFLDAVERLSSCQ